MKVHLTNYIRGNNDINNYDDWKIQVNEYDCYLKSIKDQCDKRLLNLYEKSDRFHYYKIMKLNYNGFSNFFRREGDSVELCLLSDIIGKECVIQMVFEHVKSINLFVSEKEKRELEYWLKESTIGEILFSEIAISEEGNQFFGLFTSGGFYMELEYSKVKIKQLKS